jgi:hypothetical protein
LNVAGEHEEILQKSTMEAESHQYRLAPSVARPPVGLAVDVTGVELVQLPILQVWMM